MQKPDRMQTKLIAHYDNLSEIERMIMQLCSIIQEPTSGVIILRCLQKSGAELAKPLDKRSLDIHLSRLQSLKLLNRKLQCHPIILETVARSALAAGLIRTRSKSSAAANAPKSPADYGPFVKAVMEEHPSERNLLYSNPQFCPRTMRDFRIGLYVNDRELWEQAYKQIYSYCHPTHTQPDPFVQVCNNPFDPGWFRTLPPSIMVYALQKIFEQTIMHMEPDNEQVAFAMDPGVANAMEPEDRLLLKYHLISRLLLGGKTAKAEELIATIDDSFYHEALSGWLHFIQGRGAESLAAYESGLRALRKETGKRSVFLTGPAGVFHILAMLKDQESILANLRKIGQMLDATDRGRLASYVVAPFSALRTITRVLSLDMTIAKAAPLRVEQPDNGLAVFFMALARQWRDGKLDAESIDALSNVFIRAREIGLDWLAMECAELLCVAEEDTPVRRNFINQLQSETGMQSIFQQIRIEEPWRRSLRILAQTASSPQAHAAKRSEMRLIWLVGYHDGNVSITPLEQKLGAKGQWSKGRPVALSRLHNGSKLEYISDQDRKIRASLRKESGGYYYHYGAEYYFDMNKALPALVGHPLLFLEESPTTSVEFVKGEPEVVVARSGSRLNIHLSIPIDDDAPMKLVRETPTRFKVIELTEAHRYIAKILGDEGLDAPESAKEEVVSAIAGLSSLVTVHSDVGGEAENIVKKEADPRPHIHLMPAGSGFRLEIFVRPFSDDGPYLKPGVGAASVIAEVGGERMLAKRDLKLEEEAANLVETRCPTLANLPETDRQWLLEDPEECLEALLKLKELQDEDKVVVGWPEGEKLKVTKEVSFDKLRMKIRGEHNWFDVSGELAVDSDLVLDMKRLLELLHSTDSRFLPLGDGQFLALTQELRKRLDELDAYSERRGKGGLRLHPLAALAVSDFTDKLTNLETDDVWKSRMQTLRMGESFDPVVPSTLKASLRDYQVEGYKWLTGLAHMGVGACLADDMGLGKTLQALAVMLDRAADGPTLVVAPTSVCMNWASETNRFAPTLNVTLFGSGNREEVVKGLKGFDVLVSSYGLLLQEAELLTSVEWRTIILDEAQAIKNITAKRSQAAMNLRGDFKIITTGTPIENHLGELWTLFNFINPGLLGSYDRFSGRYAVPIEKYNDRNARKRLKKLLQPFILRRTKAQVLEELPPRTEVVLQVEMSREEMAFYEALRQQALEKLEVENAPPGQKHLMILAEIMRLRRACCNPRLITPDSDIQSSKLDVFGEIVSELLENRHKALVFSQFVGHLALIREYLDQKGVNYRYLDGSTPPKERKSEVDAFQSGNGDLFLISLKAGGLGLNLTAADYVIHMDPWWNPAVEDQASDRAHRIGQQHPVTVYRLVARNTIEEKIVKLHQEKRDLAGSLLEGSDMSGKISAEELLQLIQGR